VTSASAGGELIGDGQSWLGDQSESHAVLAFQMQRDRLAQTIDQLIQRATLADDGYLETFADIPTAATADHRMHGFSEGRILMCCIARSRIRNRTSYRLRPGTAIRTADFVESSRDPLKVVDAVRVVRRSVDTATAHNVRADCPGVEMRERENDLARPEPPAATSAA
jgi:hypothetical protein